MATFYVDYEGTPLQPIPKTKEEIKRESIILGLAGGYLPTLQRWESNMLCSCLSALSKRKH